MSGALDFPIQCFKAGPETHFRATRKCKATAAMYKILDQSSGNIVGIKVGGRLSAEDFKTLAAHIEGVIAASPGKVRLLSDLSDFQWMDMAAFWDDLAFSLKHMHDFDRVAVIGDQMWLEWWTRGVNPIVAARHFPAAAIDKAWAWLREQS